jgi:hypothetical protein
MKVKKIYVAAVHRDRTTIWGAPLSEMNHGIFGYTLECGHSWNNKIPREPKGQKSLISALNKSADECRRYSDYYYQPTKEQIAYFEANVSEGMHCVTWDA